MLLRIKFKLVILLKTIFFKLSYRKRFLFKRLTFRNGFSVIIEKNGRLIIGSDCFFNNNCSINCLENVTIGNDCIFGENVKIYDHNHKFNKKNVLIKEQGIKVKHVQIGDNCWVGSNCVLLGGTTIGSNCVIGAGCVVSGNIPDNTIVKNKSNYRIEEINFYE